MKIPGRRQDSDVARMTGFLRRRIGMVAAVVVERLDQRGPAGTGCLRPGASLARPIKSWERSTIRCATRCVTCSRLLGR
jgi:hypothetical protein